MKKLALYAFIDAFGWEVYQEYGFLPDLLKNAKRLETTFGFSSAADPSILTGRYPDEHTHWSSFYYSPETSPFKWMRLLGALPPKIFDRWRVRHWLSRGMKWVLGYTGYFEMYSVPFQNLPYFDYLEKYDYFIPGGILKTDTIFDWCQEKGVPYYCSNWRHSEEKILQENKWEIASGKPKFVYLYLPKLDAVMHGVGPKHEQTKQKIKWLEKQVTDVYNLATKVYDEVSLYVISDHGMAPVTHGVDLMKVINDLPLQYGKDYIAFYDSTMARFWFKNGVAKHMIEDALAKITDGRIVTEEELKSMHVWFAGNKFGELFFLMKEGVLINPSYMGLNVIPGMHGYHPHDLHSYSFIASNRPLADELTSITDIRKTMEMELLNGI